MKLYMTIGMFKRNDYTGSIKPDFQDEYLFLLDKISLTPVDVNERICANADLEKLRIYKDDDRHDRLEKKDRKLFKEPACAAAEIKPHPYTHGTAC